MKILKGTDENGKTIELKNQNATQISDSKYQLANGRIVSLDPNELSFELYNGSDCNIVMENIHPNPLERSKFFHSVSVKKGEHAFFPHKYFTPWAEKIGNPNKIILNNIVMNFGRSMFKGNTKPDQSGLIKDPRNKGYTNG